MTETPVTALNVGEVADPDPFDYNGLIQKVHELCKELGAQQALVVLVVDGYVRVVNRGSAESAVELAAAAQEVFQENIAPAAFQPADDEEQQSGNAQTENP